VFLRWTDHDVPPTKNLGLEDLVISWNDGAPSLLESARRQGYHVYLEATPQQAAAAADAGKNIAAGILVKVSPSEQTDVDATLQSLRSLYPKLTFLILNPGKQPQMRGTLVLNKNGVLEVSSPTAQPWLDTNLALVRIEQALHRGQVPLYSFEWELTDSLQRLQGPKVEDYLLAVAEAGAFHADLVLSLHDNLQKALAHNDADGMNLWRQMQRYLEFYSRPIGPRVESTANIGVLAGDYKKSYELINLLARHNIPFRILRSTELTLDRLTEFDVLIVLASAIQQNVKSVTDFAARGGIAILVDSPGRYQSQSARRLQTGGHWVSYTAGKGRVIELSEPIPDPETFAQDIRRLMDKQKVLISLWNALTTVAVPYRQAHDGVTMLELVNYAQEPLRVQVQVKGSFHSIRYETPERGCCETLTPVQRDGFTEFVIPELRIGGRVHLKHGHAGERRVPANAK